MGLLNDLFPEKKDRLDFAIAITVILLFFGFVIWHSISDTSFFETKGEMASIGGFVDPTHSHGDVFKEYIYDEEFEMELVSLDQESQEIPLNDQERINLWLDSLRNNKLEQSLIIMGTDTLDLKMSDEPLIDTDADSLNLRVDSMPELIPDVKLLDQTIEGEPEPIIEDLKEEGIVESTIENDPIKAVPNVDPDRVIEVPNVTEELRQEILPCVIMIGAFSNKANAVKLIQDLQEENFKVYSANTRGFRTVGVRSSCDKEVLNTKLQEIRQKYSKNAFIVK